MCNFFSKPFIGDGRPKSSSIERGLNADTEKEKEDEGVLEAQSAMVASSVQLFSLAVALKKYCITSVCHRRDV